MSEAIGQPSGAALPRRMGIGEILSTRLAAVPAPLAHALLQYLLGDQVRTRGEETANRGVVETSSWAVGTAGLLTALAGVVMFLVLTGAITRAVAAEVAGKGPSLEKSYRFGFHRFLSVLLVSVLVGALLYLDLRARKERLTMEALRADLQALATPATHHQRDPPGRPSPDRNERGMP